MHGPRAVVNALSSRLEVEVARLKKERAEAKLEHARALAAKAAGADIDPATFAAAFAESEATLLTKETELGVAKAKR